MTNEEALSFIKKHPFSIACGVLSVALLVGWYFRGSDLPEMETELAKKQAEVERYRANIANAKQLKEHLDALVAANKEIGTRLVKAGDLGKNVNFFFKIEAETGAKLIDARQVPLPLRKEPLKTAFTGIPFSVGVTGDLGQLLNFLRRVESGAHYCRVLSAVCSVPPDRSGTITVSLALELLGQP